MNFSLERTLLPARVGIETKIATEGEREACSCIAKSKGIDVQASNCRNHQNSETQLNEQV